jgi:acid stress chaperone HdeB
MKLVLTALVALAFAVVGSEVSYAQASLDVAKITCWQFATYKITDPKLIAVWVSGYYHGKISDTVIDPPAVEANATKMTEFCIKNPDVPFMQAVETILKQPN